MLKQLFKSKTGLLTLFAVIILSFGMLTVFNDTLWSAVGDPVYSKITRGNHLFKGNIVQSPHPNGGNQGTYTSITGVPLTKLIIYTANDGTGNTYCWMDDAETGWSAVNARTVCTSDTDVYRTGASSLKTVFSASAVADDGAIGTDAGNQDLTLNDSFGFWMRASDHTIAGHFQLELVDVGGGGSVDVPAVFKNVWTWVECDISGIVTKNAVSDVIFKISTAGAAAHAAITVYLDMMYTWDFADETALGVDLMPDGVINVIGMLSNGGGPFVQWAEETNYIVHYESGNDFLVDVTANNTYTPMAYVAYRNY